MLTTCTVGAGKNLPLPFEEAVILLLDDGVTLTGCRPEFLGITNADLPPVVEKPLPQLVIEQVGQPRSGKGNALLGLLLGCILIGVGQVEGSVPLADGGNVDLGLGIGKALVNPS